MTSLSRNELICVLLFPSGSVHLWAWIQERQESAVQHGKVVSPVACQYLWCIVNTCSIFHKICSQLGCALFCCGYIIKSFWFMWSFYSYPSGLHHCDCPSASEVTLKDMGKIFCTKSQSNTKLQKHRPNSWDVLCVKISDHIRGI